MGPVARRVVEVGEEHDAVVEAHGDVALDGDVTIDRGSDVEEPLREPAQDHGAAGGSKASRRAATSPSMVCSRASASTGSPRSRAVAEVTGPIDTTSGGWSRGPTASQKLVTVDDDVKVERVDAPGLEGGHDVGVGRRGPGGVEGEQLDGVAAGGEPVGEDVAGPGGPRDEHRLVGVGGGGEGVEERLGDVAFGDEVGVHPARVERGGGAGPDDGDATPGEGAGVGAAGLQGVEEGAAPRSPR